MSPSMEMFKQNGFLDGNFQSVVSTFKPKDNISPIKVSNHTSSTNRIQSSPSKCFVSNSRISRMNEEKF